MDALSGFPITNQLTVEVRGVKDKTQVAIIMNEKEQLILNIDQWTELYKNTGMINDEFYKRFKYQYTDS